MSGLEGVIAAQTILSEVDGQAGRLVIRGHALDQLAGRWTFEQVIGLLLDGFFPNLPDDLATALGAARVKVFAEVASLDFALVAKGPVEAVRALVARLPDGEDLDTALALIAAPAVFTAAVVRASAGQSPIAPEPVLSHAADALRMLHGHAPDAAQAAALDAYLVTVCDHGLNASTFA
ncbi:MAG: citrate/2-methylcitrate synthase, partial [Caulobacter sp.]